jgi:hypothetical protein
MAGKNHTLISLSHITKDELDKLKEVIGNVSYDKLISTLIVDFYRRNI